MSPNWNKQSIENLVYTWYAFLNDHVPYAKIRALLSNDGIEMKFPEATLKTYPEFEAWHKTVSEKFFDQNHIIKKLDITISGDSARLSVTVNWRARTWEPPQGYSTLVNAVAEQTWVVVADPATGNPVIKKYSVDSFKPAE